MLIPTRQLDFHEALLADGLPVVGIAGSGPECVIHLAAGATKAQQNQARAMAQSFDWTEPTPTQAKRKNAKAALRDTEDDRTQAILALVRELLETVPGAPTWEQLVARAERRIDTDIVRTRT